MSDEALLELSHRPPRRRRPLPPMTAYDLARVGFFLFGFPRNAFCSIDVTKECNLRCAHCYFYEGGTGDAPDFRNRDELTVDQWIDRLEQIRRCTSRREFPFFQCTWVGGEPLVRQDLIEVGRRYFRHNTVVTNGTIPLPDWPDVNFYISIDGDERTHDEIRRKAGVYRRALRNAREHEHLKVHVAYCITKRNIECLERVILDWAEAGIARMTFDFYTPVGDTESGPEPLFVPLAERDHVLDKLIALKRIYGDFFALPERAFRLMKSDRCQQVTARCLFAERSYAFGPDGTLKEKCMMGPKADCDRCGCVVPFYMAALSDRRLILEDWTRPWVRAVRRAAEGAIAAVFDRA